MTLVDESKFTTKVSLSLSQPLILGNSFKTIFNGFILIEPVKKICDYLFVAATAARRRPRKRCS